MRTYIYGVPQGFDFYEKDVQFTDYFKSFYISSRRGRRFLINRKENGETIYTYLRYGMKEVCRQPQHAFFGMSVVMENGTYCPDLGAPDKPCGVGRADANPKTVLPNDT